MRKTPIRWLHPEQFCGLAFSSSSYRAESSDASTSAKSKEGCCICGLQVEEALGPPQIEPVHHLHEALGEWHFLLSETRVSNSDNPLIFQHVRGHFEGQNLIW
jgi:hypothetical protein